MASKIPTPKVVAGTAGGAGALVLVWIAGLIHLDMPPEVAAAVTVLLGFAAGYLRKDKTTAP